MSLSPATVHMQRQKASFTRKQASASLSYLQADCCLSLGVGAGAASSREEELSGIKY